MQCPLCHVEMKITNSYIQLENDDTPDLPTRVFIMQDLSCVNRECTNYNTVVETSKGEMSVG